MQPPPASLAPEIEPLLARCIREETGSYHPQASSGQVQALCSLCLAGFAGPGLTLRFPQLRVTQAELSALPRRRHSRRRLGGASHWASLFQLLRQRQWHLAAKRDPDGSLCLVFPAAQPCTAKPGSLPIGPAFPTAQPGKEPSP